jgi:hypothetical protein
VYTERSGGSCGYIEPSTVTVAGERVTRFKGSCPADISWSSDFCAANFELDCTEEERGRGFTNHQVSRTLYAPDGLSRSGVFEFSVFDADGAPVCASTYDSVTLNTSCSGD